MGVAWACRPRVVEWVGRLSTAPSTRGGGTTVINCEMVVSSNRPSRKVKDKQIGSRFNVFKLTQARRKGPCRSTSMASPRLGSQRSRIPEMQRRCFKLRERLASGIYLSQYHVPSKVHCQYNPVVRPRESHMCI